jgi:hypothetical protein
MMLINPYAFGGGGGGGTDPFFADTKLILNMEGADGSTTFTDLSPIGRTMTAHGDAQVDTSLGYNAALFDGTGDYISTPYVKADFDWWTGDYTIELWVRASSFATWYYTDGSVKPALIGCADPTTTTNYWSLGPDSTGDLRFYYYNGSAQVADKSGLSAGSTVHIAMMHKAADNHIYGSVGGSVNDMGAVLGTPQSSATSPVVLTLGMINNRSITGYVVAARITRALRYSTSGFTPDAYPFPTS